MRSGNDRRGCVASPLSELAQRCYDDVAELYGGKIPNLGRVIEEMDRAVGSELDAELRRTALRRAAETEDDRRTRKGNRIMRPSSQLTFEGLPDWLDHDAFLPTMDGGRYRSGIGVMRDWQALLAEADRNAEQANQVRGEKYGTFNELSPYLAEGMTNEEAWIAYRRDH